MTISKCACGRRKPKNLPRCAKCYAEANEARLSEARALVSKGVCPTCGGKLMRNLSLAGWWQCEQLGAETHRARPTDPPCGFQTFTE